MEQLPGDIVALIARLDIIQGCALRMTSLVIRKLIPPPAKKITVLKAITVEHGSVGLFDWLARQFPSKVMDQYLKKAAQRGHLGMFNYLQTRYDSNNVQNLLSDELIEEELDLTYDAIRGGNLDIVKLVINDSNIHNEGFHKLAARRGHPHILQYLHQICPIDDGGVVLAAAEGGSVECLCYLIEQKYSVAGRGILLCRAISSGNIECVKYVQEQFPQPWTEAHMNAAVNRVKAMHLVEYLYEAGCPWTKNIAYKLASHNQLELLCYTMNDGCAFPKDIIEKVLDMASVTTIDLLRRWGFECPPTCITIAAGNSLELVKYLHEAGYPLESDAIVNAIKNNAGDICHYLQTYACPIPDNMLGLIFKHGAYECIQITLDLPADTLLVYIKRARIKHGVFIHLHDRIYATTAPKWQAKYITEQICNQPNLTVFRYLHNRGYQFGQQCFQILIQQDRTDEVDCLLSLGQTCKCALKYAIKQNNLSMVKVILKYKYHWNPSMLYPAISSNPPKIFQYLISQGLCWDEDTVGAVILNDYVELLMCLVQHGLVIDADFISVLTCPTNSKCSKYIRETYPEYSIV